MIIIPAIDISEGKCVRLRQGKFKKKTVYNANPVAVGKKFEKEGARILHVVDLDGARLEKPVSTEAIFAIARAVKIPVQVGGGIRSYKEAKMYLENGIERIILSTAVLKNPQLVERLVKDFGNSRIVVSLDIRNGKLAIEGWQKTEKRSILEMSSFLKKIGIKELIITDILRDGTLKGPNFGLVKRFLSEGFKVIASGGISSLSDIQEFNKLGVYGVIIGKALYEGRIDLQEAQRVVEDKNNLIKRIIPCLDCKRWQGKWSVVKGIKFEKLRLAGEPVKLAKKYPDEGADELAMLDISASLENRRPFFNLVKRVVKAIKIPLIVGGGISTLSDIEKLLKAGASKVSLNTAIVKNPNFLTQAVKKFGSEKIVVAIDVKKCGQNWKVCILAGTKKTNLDAIKWAKEVKKQRAGELLVTSKDKDGTKEGYDLELLRKLKETTNLPIIASGGAGSMKDFLDVFQKANVDAALGASIFHYKKVSIGDLKKFLSHHNIAVRL